MPKLNKPKYIVLHTAAHGNKTQNYDTTVKQIDAWHRAKGWNGCGYHYVIRFNGSVEKGRDEKATGAHTRGLNQISIGICVSGHADYHNWTDAQVESVNELVKSLMLRYNISVDKIIGHNEAGLDNPGYKVNKSCPGHKVDMKAYRTSITAILNTTPLTNEEWGKILYDAMSVLYKFTSSQNLSNAAIKELHDVRYSEPFNHLINQYKKTL